MGLRPAMGRGRTWKLCLLGTFTLLCGLQVCAAQNALLIISSAASLTESIQEIEAVYRHDHPRVELRNNFGSSGTLAREIEQ